MLLITHIIVALLGLVAGTLAAIQPSRRKVQATYGSLALTLGSGALLMWQTHAPLVSSCLSGLAYLGTLGVMLVVAQRRLAARTILR